MKEVNLKLTGNEILGETQILIDGHVVHLQRNAFHNLEGSYQTEKGVVKIEVARLLDIGGPWWFITQLFFFIISIFGILDIHRKERCLVIDFMMEVSLEDSNHITLRANALKDDTKTFDIETELSFCEITNRYYLDNKAKKKLKWLLLTKILLALLTITIALVILIINK